MKKYDKYIKTKNIWFPELPSNWVLTKVKYVARTIAGGTPSTDKPEFWDNGNIPWLPSGKLQNCDITTAEKFITEEGLNNSSTKWIKPNTTLIALTGATCANIGYLRFKACANQSVVAIDEVSEKSNSRFIYYMFLSMRKQILTHQSGGAQAGINDSNVKNLYMVLPTLEEQIKIAQYLDHQTDILDLLIQQKEKLIELLKEKRQAVINEAVTKGLNPNAKMKDSGIEWLGEVPEHWDVTKLKFLAKLNPSKSEIENTITGDDVVSFLPMEKVEESWSYDRNSTAKYSEVSTGLTYFKEGDIIMAKITPCFENGKAAILDSLINGFGFGSTEFHTIRPVKVDRRYLFYVTRSDYFMSNGESFMTGSAGQKRVPTSFVSDFFVPIPKPTEQIEIALYIENYIEKNNKISNELKLQIDKLKEYRQSIISEAVTGKIDLRDWQLNNKQVA